MINRMFAIILATVLSFAITDVGSAGGATKITIGLPGGSAAHDPRILERFLESHPDIEVETIVFPWEEFFTKLSLMLVTDTAPDVWYGEAGRAFEWYKAGFTEDLGPRAERDLALEDFFMLDAAQDPATGAWTGVPSDFQITSLYYNIQHLASAGIPFPDETWTIRHLFESARKLTKREGDVAERWGFNLQPEYITSGWMLWIKLLGGQVLDPSRTESRLAHSDTVAALRTMGEMIHETHITPSPADEAFPAWAAVSGFQQGTTSMMFNIYSWNNFLHAYGMDEYDVAVVPASDDGRRVTTAVPNVWVVNAKSSPGRRDAAWEWIKFQVGEEAQRIRMSGGAGVPVNRNVAFEFIELPNPPDNRIVYLDSFAFAQTLEENAVWERYRRAVEEELLPFWGGQISAEEAALRADHKVGLILSELS